MPVLPLEKMTVAKESSLTDAGNSHLCSTKRGSNRAGNNARILSAFEKLRATSSIITICERHGNESFSNTLPDVKIVFSPHRAMATSIASAEAV